MEKNHLLHRQFPPAQLRLGHDSEIPQAIILYQLVHNLLPKTTAFFLFFSDFSVV